MQIGISTASLFMRQYNEEAVQTIQNLGVKTCEIFLETFSEYTRAYGEILNEKKGDLAVNSVHLYTTHIEPQLFSENERTLKDAYCFLDGREQAAPRSARSIIRSTARRAIKKHRVAVER